MALQLIVLLWQRYNYLEYYLISFERIFVIVFTLGSYFYIVKYIKDRIVYFLVGGSLFFLVGALLSLYFYNIQYMMLGAAIEVFVFSLGMGFRIKMIEKEKISFEAEINKVRLIALRAQMNPHFIFNSLNSIRAYIIASETQKASDYLTKFAKLIRLILHYSSQNTISLKDELDALELYIQLEQLRYRDDFGFEKTLHSKVDLNNWRIPPLILQPYVENAIRHGLAARKGDKKLELNIFTEDSMLVIKIKDNGVGRKIANKRTNLQKDVHKSMAMELTRKRIELTVDSLSDEKNITINDLMENGQPLGTEVLLKLPINYSMD